MTMRFSPAGRTLATTSGDADGLTLWDVTDPVHPAERGRLPRVRSEPGPKYDVMTFTPDSALLATNDDGLVSLWNLTDPAHPTLTSTVDTTATEGGRLGLRHNNLEVVITPRRTHHGYRDEQPEDLRLGHHQPQPAAAPA